MTFQVKVTTPNGSEIINLADLQTVQIQQPNAISYELINPETNSAPKSISVKRVGNNLEVAVEDSVYSNLVIEDYYLANELSPIIGVAEDGQLYSYVSGSGVNSIASLSNGVVATEVLGGTVFTPSAPLFAGLQGASWVAVGVAAGTLGTLVTPKDALPFLRGRAAVEEQKQPAGTADGSEGTGTTGGSTGTGTTGGSVGTGTTGGSAGTGTTGGSDTVGGEKPAVGSSDTEGGEKPATDEAEAERVTADPQPMMGRSAFFSRPVENSDTLYRDLFENSNENENSTAGLDANHYEDKYNAYPLSNESFTTPTMEILG